MSYRHNFLVVIGIISYCKPTSFCSSKISRLAIIGWFVALIFCMSELRKCFNIYNYNSHGRCEKCSSYQKIPVKGNWYVVFL